jgi:hypothetical protein
MNKGGKDMNDFFNEFESVFVDNDKPEFVPGLPCDRPAPPPPPPVNPKEYFRKPVVINRPYSPDPAPCHHRREKPVDNSSIPNPVPNTYFDPAGCPPRPPRPCPPPPPPPERCIHPMHWEEDYRYVTKAELNRILMHIADADIFRDLSENGTTVSVGGIKKGTKFRKLTFSQLMCLLLYPKTVSDDEEYMCKTPDGKTVLNHIVKNAYGDLKVDDDLEGMTISQIIEAMLCGKNPWGTYVWLSDVILVNAADTMIDAEVLIPQLVTDYHENRVFELHVLGDSEVTEENYKYDEIIAKKDSTQKTNVTVEGVPVDLKWSYNPESKKITLHTDTEITTPIKVVMVRR